jgi:glycerol uptake facilitator-like aquaporin
VSLRQRLAAEGLGSLLLAAAVIGSGTMAERLASGNAAVALLANTGATVAALAVLIALLGPLSGAHFNPAVTMVQALRRKLTWSDAGAFGHRRSQDAPWMVSAWIGAAYWFTASTSFANPAITIGRSLSNTFAGIRPQDVPGFIAAQLCGALAALFLARFLELTGVAGGSTTQPGRR